MERIAITPRAGWQGAVEELSWLVGELQQQGAATVALSRSIVEPGELGNVEANTMHADGLTNATRA